MQTYKTQYVLHVEQYVVKLDTIIIKSNFRTIAKLLATNNISVILFLCSGEASTGL